MADVEKIEEPKKKKGLLIPLLLGVILAAVGGGGAFWAVTQGPLAPSAGATDHDEGGDDGHGDGHADMGPVDAVFIELETLVISLGAAESNRNLIFSAAREVRPV